MKEEEIVEIVRAYGLISGTIVFREDVEPDRLVDFLAGNRAYISSIVIINKFDQAYAGVERNIDRYCMRKWYPVSVKSGLGLEELKDYIFDSLHFIRVYLKPQGKPPDMEEPLVIMGGSTVRTVCEHLHRDFVDNFRFANVWGPSAKYPGQAVGLAHELKDGDILSIILRKK